MRKKYFARANTSSGCVSFIESNLCGIDNVVLIDGSSEAVKCDLIENAAKYFERTDKKIECIYSPYDVYAPEALIIRNDSLALVSSECLAKGTEVIDTDDFIDFEHLGADKEYFESLKKRAKEETEKLYDEYKKAKDIHDEWEKIYMEQMDYERLNMYTDALLENLVPEKNSACSASEKKRFFGASTMDGSVNYIDNLTNDLSTRYFIKGRPGTGKSTFLKKLAKKAISEGYSTEIYFCSFDKNSLDMVVIPELSVCVFDSTAPHEMFPSGERDKILDFYKESGLIGIDEKKQKELDLVKHKYDFRIFEGVADLRKASGYRIECRYYYEKATDFDAVSRCADKLVRKYI